MTTTPQPNATFIERVDVAETMATFRFALDERHDSFRPGQYVSLGLTLASAFVQRPYSIVSMDSTVELFIRRVDGGALTPHLWTLRSGERVRVGPPKGLFQLDEVDRRTRIFVGTGTGLAPLLAMLERLAERGDRSPCVLIHGVSLQSELSHRERIERWTEAGLDLWYIPSVSRPDEPVNATWSGTTGRADGVLRRVFEEDPSLCGGKAYLCGNPQMLTSTTGVLIEAGMRAEDVHAERFQAGTPPVAGDTRHAPQKSLPAPGIAAAA